MKEVQIKLNDIVTSYQIKQKRSGPMHTLSNSFKRNTMYRSTTNHPQDQSYQSKLPHVNFCRKDLSIILRYILYKQEMQLDDRNLLRRILVALFDQQLIAAGTKKFIIHLKLFQNSDIVINNPENRLFYFILKGKAVVTSGGQSYQVKQGNAFGDIEILSNISFQSIEFSPKHLVLTLDQIYFNTYFKAYYQKLYKQKDNQLSCIRESFLNKIPSVNRHLLYKKISYKHFGIGDLIVGEGEPVNTILFNWRSQKTANMMNSCIGLYELVKKKNNYMETIYCFENKAVFPCISKELFQKYVIDYITITQMGMSNSFIERTANKTNFTHQPQIKQKLQTFLKGRKVKLQMTKSRMKTEPSECFETSFMFFKPDRLLSSWKGKRKVNGYERERQNRSFMVKSRIVSQM